MASSISVLHSPPSCSLCRRNPSSAILPSSLPSFPLRVAHRRNVLLMESRVMTIKALLGEETSVVEGEGADVATEQSVSEGADVATEQSVSVPVSPSDVLTMFFKAEGSMDEAAIRNVKSSLEGVEGISNLKVKVLEGIASVELAKQTTVQATGVASSLVETIQGSGFKLQTLHLSFDDEEDSI